MREKQLQIKHSRYEGRATWVPGVPQNRLCQQNKRGRKGDNNVSLKIGPRELRLTRSEMRYKAHDPISIALVEQSNQVLENELF